MECQLYCCTYSHNHHWICKRLHDLERGSAIKAAYTFFLSLFFILGLWILFRTPKFTSSVLLAIFEQVSDKNLPTDFNLLVPLGISYFTFQTLSYITDIYRGIIKTERHVGIYALFIAFFPHVTAGPIARANDLLPQFHAAPVPDYEQVISGFQRVTWGFFKKLVIADRLSAAVNAVYNAPTAYTGFPLILATYAFAYQIYCDFSGYADIAIGVARVLGIKLQENFNQPYLAPSIIEFWRRWHISLYNWLRDYIFYPLNRALKRKFTAPNNIVILVFPPMFTMLASGFWHGATWNFIVWGALHGIFMVGSILWNLKNIHLNLLSFMPSWSVKVVNILVTFHLVCFAWIFFRANSMTDALYIIQNLFTKPGTSASLSALMPLGWYDWLIAILAIFLMETIYWVQRKKGSLHDAIRHQPVWVRWLFYYALVMAIVMFGKFGRSEFIYARF